MRIVDIEQRSDLWKKWRAGRVTASDCAAIMGESPWSCAEDVFMDKLGLGKERVVSAAMQQGIDLESTALAMLNKMVGYEFKPCVVESDDHHHLGASLDGFYGEMEPFRAICEIKCVTSKKGLMDTIHGIVPKHYAIQIQSQLICSGADLCFYCVYFDGDIAVVEVRPDAEMQQRIIDETKAFWERVQNLEPPEPKYIEREDQDWLIAVANLTALQRDIKLLQDRESEAKARLIELSNGKSTKGYGMGVIHSVRAGGVDYSKLCEENKIDAAKYRKPATQVVTVRKVK